MREAEIQQGRTGGGCGPGCGQAACSRHRTQAAMEGFQGSRLRTTKMIKMCGAIERYFHIFLLNISWKCHGKTEER